MQTRPNSLSRRQVLAAAVWLGTEWIGGKEASGQPAPAAADQDSSSSEFIIDIHQHTNYSGRTDAQLFHHQQAMGVGLTLLLPAGSPVKRPSTHDGKSNGLAAGCGTIESCVQIARQRPGEYRSYANEVPDLPGARDSLVRYLKAGAVGIGEQKFNLPCDSGPIEMVAQVAAEFGVPVLMHFQHGMYNEGFPRFHKVLEKFPKVNFIGHAQTFWAYIDKNCDPGQMYPKGKVTPGGLTDRYLSDYPNMWADISAGSGLNSMIRDEEHARDFLGRHQDKVLFGSDCNDVVGRGPTCQGWLILHTVRRLADATVQKKIFHANAQKLFRLK